MRTIESSNPDMDEARKHAAAIIAGTGDGGSQVGKRGVAKQSRTLRGIIDHEAF
jgi:hypothetical protein